MHCSTSQNLTLKVEVDKISETVAMRALKNVKYSPGGDGADHEAQDQVQGQGLPPHIPSELLKGTGGHNESENS